MKMVILTQLEARHVLHDLELVSAEDVETDLEMSIEIMEEALLQPQEVEIPDGKASNISDAGH